MKTNSQSLDLAYEIAKSSDEWVAKRWDALDTKLQTTGVLAMGLAGGTPVIFRALELKFPPAWAVPAIACFVLALALTAIARIYGSIGALNPGALYHENWLNCEPADFKMDFVKYAGSRFIKNARKQTQRYYFLAGATVLMGAGVAVAAVALAVGHS